MAKQITDISLADILPSSIASDPQVKAMVTALDGELQSLSVDTRDAIIYSRVDELPEKVLNILAWASHADFWDDRLGIRAKRYHVKNSILMHMRKGTRDAILNGLRMIGADAEISAWHEYGGSPYHFRIDALITDDTTDALADEEVTSLVREVIDATKSERDTLDALRLGILIEDWLYRVSEDIKEDLRIEPLYTFSDSIDYPGQVYGYRHRYSAPVRYGSRRTYGLSAKYGGTMDERVIRFGKGWDAMSMLSLAISGFADTVSGALQRYGHAAFGEGDTFGPGPSVVDGGIGLRVSRQTRYGEHHSYSHGIEYGAGKRFGDADAEHGGGRLHYGFAEFSEIV